MQLQCKTAWMYGIAIYLLFFSAGFGGAQPKVAPSWQGTEWINLPTGVEDLDIEQLRGKVVYLSFFQKW